MRQIDIPLKDFAERFDPNSKNNIVLEALESAKKELEKRSREGIKTLQKQSLAYAETVPEEWKDRAVQWANSWAVRWHEGDLQVGNTSEYHQDFESGNRQGVKPSGIGRRALIKGGVLNFTG